MKNYHVILCTVLVFACSDKNADDDTTPEHPYEVPENNQTGIPPTDETAANVYSWDGSWNPSSDAFPIDGMLDETHNTLPPGKWGWDNDCDCPGDEGLAIYENEFVDKGVDFEQLLDADGNHFGWRMVSTTEDGIAMNHRADNFEGSTGVDIMDLAPGGELTSSDGINLGEGPDMLRYATGWSLDMRTGADTSGALYDNDLVILGSEADLPLNEYDIQGTTIHTGPGSDLVFVRNFGPAAIDLGNGLSGRTDTMDEADGDDMIILEGNMRDFRVFCGQGDDVAIWYVDEVNDDRWLGPNFYGSGGWGDAIWSDPGTDRLILAIDPTTEVVSIRGNHDNNPGSLLLFIYDDYATSIDGPTEEDVNARYYGLVPEGPTGERTITLSYRAPDESVFTHDFYMTAFEELQLGLGADAAVYEIDNVSGTAALNTTLAPLEEIPQRDTFNTLFETFGR